MIYAEILAGGSGTRIGNELPKQFLMLNGKPIIIYSINQFLKNERIDKIIIVCIPSYIEHLKKIIKKYVKDSSKIDIVEGGKTRDESVINGCNYILEKYGLNDNDVIIIHDSVRPFVNQKIINDNIDAVLKYGAVGTAIPVTDTIFESFDNRKIINIPIRKNLYQAQSPQSFNIKKLMEFYYKLNDYQKDKLTDFCKIFTLNKEKVKIVEGDYTNIKITQPNDLNIAKGIINSKNYQGDVGTLPYKIIKMCNNLDWLSIITVLGVVVSFLILDVGIRFFTRKEIFFYSTLHPAPLLFSLSYILVFIFIIYKLPKKVSSIFYGIIFGLFWFYTLAELIHFKILNRFFTVYDMLLVEEANDNLNFVWGYFDKVIITFFTITLLIGIINFLLIKKSRGFYNLFKKKLTIILVIGLVLIIRFSALTLLGKPVPEKQWNSWNYPRNIYNTFSNANRSLRVSGVYEYLFRDLYLNITNKLFNDKKELIDIIENYNNERFKDYEKENEYTAYFKDKNLIMIMLESVDSWLVTEDYMPTLYKLQNEGWNFVNRYAPSFGSGSTINTEFSALTGLHSPIQGSASYNYVKNLFPFSLPNLFKNEGYVVNSLHFNYGSFYNRSNLHKALGFDNHYALIDMGFSNDFMDDRELINNDEVYKLIIPDKKQKFMTFITTYSVHGPYGENNYLCQKIFNENPEIITDDRELTCVSELSKITDEFVQKLIERLTEDELINDTVLVIFTDHCAYGYSKVYDVKNIKDSNLIQNVPFIIWHNDIDKKIIEKIVTSSDIMPTIANLFGLTFNPNYYVGTDVFNNKHDNFVYFSDYSWYDGEIYYQGEEILDYEDSEYIQKISNKVRQKIEINDAILNSDYYRYLIKGTSK